MANVKNYNLRTRTARTCKGENELAVRDRFYPCQAGAKRLGYIKREAPNNGTWLVVESLPGGREKQVVIGLADDYCRPDGVKVLTYEQAMQKAAGGEELVSAAGALTVAQVIKTYYDIMGGSDPNAEAYRGQLNKHVTDELNATRVDKLSPTQLKIWFADLTRPKVFKYKDKSKKPKTVTMALSSANRVLGQLKAALNAAYDDPKNCIPSASAWDRRVKPHKDADEPRGDILELGQVKALIAAAATFDQALANIMEATYWCGARPPGELAGLDVRDFDASIRNLSIRGRGLKGGKAARRSKTGPREVTLTKEATEFFARMAKGKLPSAPLLPGLDGQRWPAQGHFRDVKKAAAIAELPASVCLYTLRHAHISHAVEAGANLKLLALNCGTSVQMINKYYAKIVASTRQDQVQRTFPNLYAVK